MAQIITSQVNMIAFLDKEHGPATEGLAPLQTGNYSSYNIKRTFLLGRGRGCGGQGVGGNNRRGTQATREPEPDADEFLVFVLVCSSYVSRIFI